MLYILAHPDCLHRCDFSIQSDWSMIWKAKNNAMDWRTWNLEVGRCLVIQWPRTKIGCRFILVSCCLSCEEGYMFVLLFSEKIPYEPVHFLQRWGCWLSNCERCHLLPWCVFSTSCGKVGTWSSWASNVAGKPVYHKIFCGNWPVESGGNVRTISANGDYCFMTVRFLLHMIQIIRKIQMIFLKLIWPKPHPVIDWL